MEYKRYYLFSNGTEFMTWQEINCCQCAKAVFYDDIKDKYPKYRCAIQRDIEEACITDGMGSKRVHAAVRAAQCPFLQKERKKHKKAKKNKDQLELFNSFHGTP